jgi:cell division protein ZapA (FtsZ GTPase activity inhibitor)
MKSHLYTINLLGTTLTVKTTEELGYLQKLEQELSDAIDDVQENLGIQDALSAAIMAGIFLADQLHQKEEKKASHSKKDEQFIHHAMNQTITLIDQILDK